MKSLRVVCLSLGLTIMLMGCPGDDSSQPPQLPPLTFTAPTPEAQAARAQIEQAHPGARVRLSQRTGRIASVSTLTTAEVTPLWKAESNGTNDNRLEQALLDYFSAHGQLYGLTNPRLELQAPTSTANPELNGVSFQAQSNDVSGNIRSLRFSQAHNGVRIEGHYAVGLFDHWGNLHTVLTRIRPSATNLNSVPTYSPAIALALASDKVEDAVSRALEALPPGSEENPLYWLPAAINEAETSVELLYESTSLQDLNAPLRLVYRVYARYNLNIARLTFDAVTRELIHAQDATPSEWYTDGTFANRVLAQDENNATHRIWSTSYEGRLYMGFSGDTGIVNPGNVVNISDSLMREDRSLTYFETINGPFTVGPGTGWTEIPGYTGMTRAATSLMRSLSTILSWWQARDWRSWDGRGSTLWTSVNNNKTETGRPQRNAWGAGGIMQIGDGVDAGGYTYGASLEVVGHEMTHNVISATSRLEYANESGAINESLADLFGIVLTARGDRLADAFLGNDASPASRGVRNFINPSVGRLPEMYSHYEVTTGDFGGVHVNSSILNKAWALMIEGGTFRGYTIEALGVAAVETTVRNANRRMRMDTNLSMEEFAMHILEWCAFEDFIRVAISREEFTPPSNKCSQMEKAFLAVQLLPGGIGTDLAVESAAIVAGQLVINVRNISLNTHSILSRFTVYFDAQDGEILTEPVTDLAVYPHRGSTYRRDSETEGLPPGHSASIRFSIPHSYYYQRSRDAGPFNLRLDLVPDSPVLDSNLANNSVTYRVGLDLMNSATEWLPASSSDPTITLATATQNRPLLHSTFPTGLKAVYLTRSTSTGAFTEITNPNIVNTCVEGGNCAYLPRGLLFPNGPTPWLVTTEAVPMAGMTGRYEVRISATSGLLAFVEGTVQLYALMDATDLIDETDETNNLICLNCIHPESMYGGVVVRLAHDYPVDTMFPPSYRAAARKLREPLRLRALPRTLLLNDLPTRIDLRNAL